MDGEIRLKLRGFDQEKVTKIFTNAYPNNLASAYARSAYDRIAREGEKTLTSNDFCAGYHTNDSLFLVYWMEADVLKVYVETVNNKDMVLMKATINRYFQQITRLFDNQGMNWSKPEATITLEDCPFYGFVKTRKERFAEIWKAQKEKLFVTPIASLLASYFALKVNILPGDDLLKDMKKAVILTAEAYIGIILVLFFEVILKSSKKVFTFNF